MTALKTINISMFTKIKNYMLVLKQNECILEEPIHDYKLFQFMCQLEMDNIHKVLEGYGKDTHIDINMHQEYIDTLVVQLNLLQYVLDIVQEEGVVYAASILLKHSFDLYTVHRITNLSIPFLRNLENTLSKEK
ncbi:hypothetical protein P4V72_04955 [Bacillus thuringiensis]|uniref:Uncharacterized protein n=1 Tax=Bacillus thuringiensis TaxID=1428 RepID=A0A9W3TKV9_BACTU|nr:hypothetical protein [Bacillus thuringiensis]AQY42500.1 hypothetical protein B4918_31890 [Bacillus thuringiensis]MDR4148636.1 hypothetical protein [Bacillus thuringiensis]MEC3569983.1 hypothetical protein [Bacillus thuringiensis]MED2021627.1 hypothetical protein [Bacillus thuringiensis]MED2140563.1 hypothetical protein [Bacillus thuringiensis]